ncbi:MAG: aminotransferase class V-fold PLP-dependent enzyme [Candidatus Aminicenantes bacterium]|nr:aminotransferase class V-fold PLP-dependent enzyme [Candidatus Aminicenantes bacterium]
MRRAEFVRGAAAALGTLTLSGTLKAQPFRRLLVRAEQEGEEALWRVIREQFVLNPDSTYLNFGGLGAMPLPVIRSYEEWSRAEERSPGAGYDEKNWNEVKVKTARILGKSCRAEDLAFISTATEGINMILNGLPLKKGDEVITSSHEHISLKAALLNLRKRSGVVYRTFDPDLKSGPGNVDRIAALVNSRTRLIFLSHLTCTYGQVFPVKDIAALARAKGLWFALDGAQAAASIPFDLEETGADFYTASCHKWMMAPKRTGFLYVRKDMLDILQPLTVGAGSAERTDMAAGEIVPKPNAGRFEYGTQNEALFFALGTAVDFIEDIGLDRVQAYGRGLAEAFYAGLRDIPGAESVSPEEAAYRSPMISFRISGRDYQDVIRRMGEARIRVRPVNENGLNCIRVSFYINNAVSDVEKILNVLKKSA